MAIVPVLCPLSGQLMLDLNAGIMRGAQIFTYQAETTTPRTVFKDYGCTVAQPNPMTVNAYGRIPEFYVDVGDYKVVLKDPAGVLVGSYEHLTGGQQSATGSSSTSSFTTGDYKMSGLPVPQTGWVVANGGTIGSGVSSATGRANDDTQPLFVALWNAMPQLVVTPSRGSSATLDFQAGKTLAVPDFRGRVPAGMDKMGAATTAGRITSLSTATPDQSGAAFGFETTTLTVTQLPTFTPSVSMGGAGGHGHSASADVQGAHAHGGSTDAQGVHSHTFTGSNTSNVTTSGSGGAANNGNVTRSTDPAGNHAHNIGTDVQGAHSHNITISGVGDHVHPLTSSPIGGGGAHSNMAPTILVYVHIKL